MTKNILSIAILFLPLIAMEEQSPFVKHEETEMEIPSSGKIVRVYGFYESGKKTIFFFRMRVGEEKASTGVFKNPDNTYDFLCNRKFPCAISAASAKFEKYERMFNAPYDITWRKLQPKAKISVPNLLVPFYEQQGMKKNSDGTYSK